MSLTRRIVAAATVVAAAMSAACAKTETPPPTSRAAVIDRWSASEQPAFAQRTNDRWRVRTRGADGLAADILDSKGKIVVHHQVAGAKRKIEDVFLLGDTALVVETTPVDVVENGGKFAPKRVVRYRLPSPTRQILDGTIPLPSPSSPWAAGPTYAAFLHRDSKNALCVVVLNLRQLGCAPAGWGIQALQVDDRAVTWQQGSQTCAQVWGVSLAGGIPRRLGGSGCGEWEAVQAGTGSVWTEIDRADPEHAAIFARDRQTRALGRAFTGTVVSCGGWTWWRAAASYAPDLSLQLRRWKPGGQVETVYTTPKADGMVMSRPECAGSSVTFEVGDLTSNVFQLLRVHG